MKDYNTETHTPVVFVEKFFRIALISRHTCRSHTVKLQKCIATFVQKFIFARTALGSMFLKSTARKILLAMYATTNLLPKTILKGTNWFTMKKLNAQFAKNKWAQCPLTWLFINIITQSNIVASATKWSTKATWKSTCAFMLELFISALLAIKILKSWKIWGGRRLNEIFSARDFFQNLLKIWYQFQA